MEEKSSSSDSSHSSNTVKDAKSNDLSCKLANAFENHPDHQIERKYIPDSPKHDEDNHNEKNGDEIKGIHKLTNVFKRRSMSNTLKNLDTITFPRIKFPSLLPREKEPRHHSPENHNNTLFSISKFKISKFTNNQANRKEEYDKSSNNNRRFIEIRNFDNQPLDRCGEIKNDRSLLSDFDTENPSLKLAIHQIKTKSMNIENIKQSIGESRLIEDVPFDKDKSASPNFQEIGVDVQQLDRYAFHHKVVATSTYVENPFSGRFDKTTANHRDTNNMSLHTMPDQKQKQYKESTDLIIFIQKTIYFVFIFLQGILAGLGTEKIIRLYLQSKTMTDFELRFQFQNFVGFKYNFIIISICLAIIMSLQYPFDLSALKDSKSHSKSFVRHKNMIDRIPNTLVLSVLYYLMLMLALFAGRNELELESIALQGICADLDQYCHADSESSEMSFVSRILTFIRWKNLTVIISSLSVLTWFYSSLLLIQEK